MYTQIYWNGHVLYQFLNLKIQAWPLPIVQFQLFLFSIRYSRSLFIWSCVNFLRIIAFGFRRKCYTTLAVLHLVAALLKLFHNKTYCICLLLDLRKAFDTVKNVIFADDAAYYAESVNIHELVETIQGFFSTLSDLLKTNKLVVHESKTKLMLLHCGFVLFYL